MDATKELRKIDMHSDAYHIHICIPFSMGKILCVCNPSTRPPVQLLRGPKAIQFSNIRALGRESIFDGIVGALSMHPHIHESESRDDAVIQTAAASTHTQGEGNFH